MFVIAHFLKTFQFCLARICRYFSLNFLTSFFKHFFTQNQKFYMKTDKNRYCVSISSKWHGGFLNLVSDFWATTRFSKKIWKFSLGNICTNTITDCRCFSFIFLNSTWKFENSNPNTLFGRKIIQLWNFAVGLVFKTLLLIFLLHFPRLYLAFFKICFTIFDLPLTSISLETNWAFAWKFCFMSNNFVINL